MSWFVALCLLLLVAFIVAALWCVKDALPMPWYVALAITFLAALYVAAIWQ